MDKRNVTSVQMDKICNMLGLPMVSTMNVSDIPNYLKYEFNPNYTDKYWATVNVEKEAEVLHNYLLTQWLGYSSKQKG